MTIRMGVRPVVLVCVTSSTGVTSRMGVLSVGLVLDQ